MTVYCSCECAYLLRRLFIISYTSTNSLLLCDQNSWFLTIQPASPILSEPVFKETISTVKEGEETDKSESASSVLKVCEANFMPLQKCTNLSSLLCLVGTMRSESVCFTRGGHSYALCSSTCDHIQHVFMWLRYTVAFLADRVKGQGILQSVKLWSRQSM